MVDYSHVIVGAGVVGLSIGSHLSRLGHRVLLLEKNSAVGAETSSRNSEVIHAGFYYPPESLKSQLCIRGKELIYNLQKEAGFKDLRQCGKWIIAQSPLEAEHLQKLLKIGKAVDVPLEFISLEKARALEPVVIAREAVLESPSTGIISAYSLMQYLESQITENGGNIALLTEVKNIEKNSNGWTVECQSVGEPISISTAKLINSAGLYAPNFAQMVGLSYTAAYAKGNYFAYSSASGNSMVQRLIYPCPSDQGSLGTHLTIGLTGDIKFGPDFEWVDSPTDYRVNVSNIDRAKQAIGRFMRIDTSKLVPDYSGIRPKLHCNVNDFQDFVIEEPLPGFINMVGIESPGLTSSMAIAEYVEPLVT